MNKEFPNIKAGASIGEIYNPAIELAKSGDTEKAERYFNALVDHVKENSTEDLDLRGAIKIVHSNIGYWAGYFEKGTIEKVYEVYGSSHPVFGTSHPTSSEAFKMGLELGKSLKK